MERSPRDYYNEFDGSAFLGEDAPPRASPLASERFLAYFAEAWAARRARVRPLKRAA